MICLLCLEELNNDDFFPIFEKNETETEISKILKKYFEIDLSEEVLPNKICSSCWYQLNEFQQFCLRIEQKRQTLDASCTAVSDIKCEAVLLEEDLTEERGWLQHQPVKEEPEDIRDTEPAEPQVGMEMPSTFKAAQEFESWLDGTGEQQRPEQLYLKRKARLTINEYNKKTRRIKHRKYEDPIANSTSNVSAVLVDPPDENVEPNSDDNDEPNSNENYESNSNFNQDAMLLLRAILKNQKDIQSRMTALEKSFNKNIIAQTQVMHEYKVMFNEAVYPVCRMTEQIEDDLLNEISETLPLSSIEATHYIEDKLTSQEYGQALKMYIFKLKGVSKDVGGVLRKVISDELLDYFNWDGRRGKKALNKLVLIDRILYDVFKSEGRHQYEKNMKKSIELSHNRMKQKKFTKKHTTESTLIKTDSF